MAVDGFPKPRQDTPPDIRPWRRGGDFTLWRYVADLSPRALELSLGLHPGRLDQGAVLCTIYPGDLDGLTIGDFSLGASTRWSRSSAAAPWAPGYATFQGLIHGETRRLMEPNAVESKLALGGLDIDELRRKALKHFRKDRQFTPAKLFPIHRHDGQCDYPDAPEGWALPQFRLHNPMRWVVRRRIAPRTASG